MPKGVREHKFKFDEGHVINDNGRDIVIVGKYSVKKNVPSKATKNGYTNRIKKYYRIKCNKCGYVGDIEYFNLLNRMDNCPCCSGKIVCSGINDINTTDSHLVVYFKNKTDALIYSRHSNKKVVCVCPDCGSERLITISQLTYHGFSCKECSDGISYPNKFSYAFLKQLPVYNIIHEFTSNELGSYRYDNYFEYNGIKYLVEMQGGFHYTESVFHDLSKQVETDKRKEEIALNNGYVLIKIDCKNSNMEYIRSSILSSEFNDIFDLSCIDWEFCSEFSVKNIARTISDIWSNNRGKISISDISKTIGISTATVTKYLVMGKNFGWNDYKTRKELTDETLTKVVDLIGRNQDYTSTKISEVLGISKVTVRRYLETATKNGLCVYDKNLEKYNSRLKSKQNLLRTPRKVLACNICGDILGEYNSISHLVSRSVEEFGISMTYEGIRRVCTGIQKQHRGFIFKYKH